MKVKVREFDYFDPLDYADWGLHVKLPIVECYASSIELELRQPGDFAACTTARFEWPIFDRE